MILHLCIFEIAMGLCSELGQTKEGMEWHPGNRSFRLSLIKHLETVTQQARGGNCHKGITKLFQLQKIRYACQIIEQQSHFQTSFHISEIKSLGHHTRRSIFAD